MIKLISKTLWGGDLFFFNYSDVSWYSLAFSFQLQSHKKYLNIVYWLRLSIKQGRFAALTVRGNYREIFTLKFYATFYHLKERSLMLTLDYYYLHVMHQYHNRDISALVGCVVLLLLLLDLNSSSTTAYPPTKYPLIQDYPYCSQKKESILITFSENTPSCLSRQVCGCSFHPCALPLHRLSIKTPRLQVFT